MADQSDQKRKGKIIAQKVFKVVEKDPEFSHSHGIKVVVLN
jgi:uncharacterized protein YwbE